MIKTLYQKLEEVTTPAIAKFIVYYYTPEDKRIPWDEFKTCHDLIKRNSYEDCCKWLTREDAIKAIQVYHKHMKDYNLSMLYDTMLKKAMEGDVNAARWVESFSKSDYFNTEVDEIEDFLSGVYIKGIDDSEENEGGTKKRGKKNDK